MMKPVTVTILFASLLLLQACSMFGNEPEAPPLEGERISILELQKKAHRRTIRNRRNPSNPAFMAQSILAAKWRLPQPRHATYRPWH